MSDIIKIWELKWGEELETGHPQIDNFHKSLADKANTIYNLCTNPKTKKSNLENFLKITEELLLEHFQVEISLFKKYKIKQCEDHQDIHDSFKKTIEKIKEDNHSSLVKAVLLNQLIIHYLTDHMPKDKECIKEVHLKQQILE